MISRSKIVKFEWLDSILGEISSQDFSAERGFLLIMGGVPGQIADIAANAAVYDFKAAFPETSREQLQIGGQVRANARIIH